MLKGRVKNYLEIGTNIAIVVVAVAVLGTVIRNYLSNRKPAPYPNALKRGSVMADVKGAELNKYPRTLILALSTQCRYCTQSVPFYKRLLQANAQVGGQINIIALFPESREQVEEYTTQNQLQLKTVSLVDHHKVNIEIVPYLVLVDSNREVLETWFGKLSQDDEEDVIKTVLKNNKSVSEASQRETETNRSLSIFNEGKSTLSVRPEDQPENPILSMISYFDVDRAGSIYIFSASGRSVRKFDSGGKEVGSIPMPKGFNGPFCVDEAGRAYLPGDDGIHVYLPSLAEERVIPVTALPYSKDSMILKMAWDKVSDSIYIQVYEWGPVSQKLYKLDPSTLKVGLVHQQQNPVIIHPTLSPGAFDFAVGDKYLYVSDIYEYKVVMYSKQGGFLVREYHKPFERRAIERGDGNLTNRKVTIANLGGSGQLKFYPPIFHLNFTNSGHLLIWTSNRDKSLKQQVDVYDAELNYVGVDRKYVDPGISNYVFANGKVYAPDYGFERAISKDRVSPFELPSIPLDLKVFEERMSKT